MYRRRGPVLLLTVRPIVPVHLSCRLFLPPMCRAGAGSRLQLLLVVCLSGIVRGGPHVLCCPDYAVAPTLKQSFLYRRGAGDVCQEEGHRVQGQLGATGTGDQGCKGCLLHPPGREKDEFKLFWGSPVDLNSLAPFIFLASVSGIRWDTVKKRYPN